jgi:probable phosphoglycerate mutase
MEFRALEDLCELHMGTWEGMTFDEVRTRYPESFKQRRENIAHYRTPGGESFADLSKRVLPVFFGFVETSTGNIAIVSHAGVNRVILCSLMSLPLEKVLTLEQHYAAVNVIEKKGPSFSVLEMNRALTCPL